jgi:uncharacterized paraquat-inducible protein A
MSEQVINFQLVSKGIQLPKGLSPEWSELLKGLLTRDHEKRWRWEQVERWLAGERNQATHYEGDRQETKSCTSCGQSVDADAVFCPKCGGKQA